MSGPELRMSMLFRADTQAARTAIAGLRGETVDLGAAVQKAGQIAQTGSSGLAGFGAAGRATASDLQVLAAGGEDVASILNAMRAVANPLVGQYLELEQSLRGVAQAEDLGVLSAREAALATDQLARAQIALRDVLAATGTAIEANGRGFAVHETALQRLIGQTTGMTRAEEGSIAATLQRGQALDALRARFDPLFAASRAYEMELREIAEAEREGALSAQIAAQARERAAQQLVPAIRSVGQASQNSGLYVTQLGYQLNDIGMMMAMGQSPFMLMMQQGPQVVQVFGQMRAAGVGLGVALRGAFAMLVNPISLATMAVIGFGAAAVQWFAQAEDAAESAADATARLGEIEGGLREARAILDLSLGELIEKYGVYALAVRDAARAQEELRIAQGRTALAEGIREAADDWDRLAARMDAGEAIRQYRELEEVISATDWAGVGTGPAGEELSSEVSKTVQVVRDLQDLLGVSESQAIALADAFRAVRDAASFEDRLVAMRELLATLRAAGVSFDELPVAVQNALTEANGLTLEMAALRGEIDGGVDAMIRLVQAAPGGGWLAGAISDAGILAGQLWEAATAAAAAAQARVAAEAQLDQMKIEFSPGGQALLKYGSRTPGGTSVQNALEDRNTPAATGSTGAGSGGGAGAEADALAELLKREREQIAALQALSPLQAEIQRNHEALAKATDAERQEVIALIEERMRLEEVRDKLDEIGRTGEQAFTGLLSGAHGFADAISMVITKLAEMAASSAWDLLWNGAAGGGGGLMGWLSGLLGLPAKADGGKVEGPGGPREDNLLHWLSAGEYIVNAHATAANLPLLEAINAGVPVDRLVDLVGGRHLPALADGGLAGVGASAPGSWRNWTGGGSASTGGGPAPGTQPGSMRIALEIGMDQDGNWEARVRDIATEASGPVAQVTVEQWSRKALPGRMAQIQSDPRRIG